MNPPNTEDKKLRDLIHGHPKLTVAVDVDGTLATYDEWRGFFHIGAPIPAVVERIKAWRAAGARIVVWTCRVTTADNKVYLEAALFLKMWLQEAGIEYDEIWMSTGKPFANIYLDDHGYNVNCEACMREVDLEANRRLQVRID